MDTEGHFYYQLSYPIDIQSNTVRYSLDDGQNWLPSSSGQTVASGDYKMIVVINLYQENLYGTI